MMAKLIEFELTNGDRVSFNKEHISSLRPEPHTPTLFTEINLVNNLCYVVDMPYKEVVARLKGKSQ